MAAHRLTTEEFIRRAKKKFKDQITFEKTNYTTKKNRVTVTCVVHGDFDVLPLNYLKQGIACTRCSGYKVTKEDFIEKARKRFGDIYDYSKVVYKNTYTKVEIVCRKHGSFWMTPITHYDGGSGCRSCFYERKILSFDDFVGRAKEKHGNFYDYSKVNITHTDKHVKIICPKHGVFKQKPRVHLDGSGCVECYYERNRSTAEQFITNAKDIHGDRYDYSKVVYTHNKAKVEIICPKHGSFYITPNSHLTGPTGCTKCIESKGETRIRTFLEKHGIEYVKEYKVDGYPYRYDFYIPHLKMFIEHHGQQHFKPVERFGGVEAWNELLARDEAKVKLAKELGYYLLETTYRLMERNGMEIALEMALRFRGHVFQEGTTITSNGPHITDNVILENLPNCGNLP